ncbi:MAG: hypothetical protein EB060_10685 [Proteobacteria bacterium]|nr:hypothetical protein [Pseudomonadota bacterium]
MARTYTRRELTGMDTIQQAWDGDMLKIDETGYRVWLVHRENRQWNGDYIIETMDDRGRWEQESMLFS